MQDTLKALALLILFGLAGLVFVWGFVFLIIARQRLLEITAQGWRYRTGFLLLKVVSLGWSEIAYIGAYCHVGPQTTTSYLAVLPRSEAVRAALDKGTPPSSLPAMFSGDVRKISLSYVFLRVTPQACERLLQNLQTTCASEIARNGVYLEPKVQ